MQEARHFLVDLFRQMGFKTKILKGKKHDAVFASLDSPKQKRRRATVLIYGHYDVQPPEPIEEWKTPPFEPTIKGGKIFGRGTADNKGQHMIQIMAIKKLLAEGKKLPINFKFIIEGEEEIGSISIEDLAQKYSKNLFKCDYLMVSDTGMPKKGQPAIDTGLRGLLYTEVLIQTAKHDLHSGTFGGVAENPTILLARLIAKLKGEDGKISIPGFYDDVQIPKKDELKKIRKNLKNAKELIREGELFGLGGGEGKYALNERKWIRPTLDVNGIWGGYTEEGEKTIIPYKASAKISMRLVPNQHPDKIFHKFEKYARTLVPEFAKVEVTRLADCLPYYAPTSHPVFNLMNQSLKKVYGREAIFKRIGGSIGFVPIMANALKVPVLMVGFELPGSNLHAPNEWLSLENYYKGIDVMTDFYQKLPNLAE